VENSLKKNSSSAKALAVSNASTDPPKDEARRAGWDSKERNWKAEPPLFGGTVTEC